MAVQKIKMPYFCKGVKSKLQEALDEGGIFYDLDRIIWDIDPENNHFYFVNTDKIIHEIVGDNEELVKRVDVLPTISEAHTNVLYILNNTVYTFDGSAFYPTYQDVSDDINEMAQNIAELSASIEEIQSTISEHSTAISGLNDSISEINTSISGINDSIDSLDGSVDGLTESVNSLNTSVETLTINLATTDGKADSALSQLENVYTKGEVDELIEDNIGDLVDPDTGAKVDVKDYVDATVESAIQIIKV